MDASPSDLTDVRMHERLAVILARDIVSSRLPEAAVFPTGDEVVREHGVSRTVAREALQALAAAGLVHVQHGKRTIVSGLAEWRFLDPLVQRAMQSEVPPERIVRDLYETRLCVEVETARLCTIRCSDGTIEALHAVLAGAGEMLRNAGGEAPSQSAMIAHDRSFHGLIADGSGNVVLARMARDAHRGLLTAWPAITLDMFERIESQHREIAQQIERRNPAAAADAIRRHIAWSYEDEAATLERGRRRQASRARG